ncbi:Methyltransferase domain-containing protein OS=Lysinibacillus sphaericus OX=1421 GN=LS41612_21290 PE=4 SV=1 [Lysinibacillus sphaericus]
MSKRIQYLYKHETIDIIQYFKEIYSILQDTESIEDILISYDFQAGNCTKCYKRNPNAKKHHLKNLIEVLDDLNGCKTILEVGVGEATSLLEIIKSSRVNYDKIFGFDLSWSRIKYAKKLLEEGQLSEVELFTVII